MNLAFADYLDVASVTSRGLVRDLNEDSFFVDITSGFFVVADGMGGGDAGDVASGKLCYSLKCVAENSYADSPGLRKYNVMQKICDVNRTILDFATEHGFPQMGTTLAMFLLDTWDAARAWICFIGDSRIYRQRGECIERLTEDHTVGAELQRTDGSAGGSTNHRNNPLSHVLTRAVGVSSDVFSEWKEIDILPKDKYLICSDGVTTMLQEAQISIILQEALSAEDAVRTIEEQVMHAGAEDNFTAIVIGIKDLLPEKITPTGEELKESEYLMKISRERNRHA